MHGFRGILVALGSALVVKTSAALQVVRPEAAAIDAMAAVTGGVPGELRVILSLRERTLWVVAGADTLLTAPIAVASDAVLQYGGRRWRFTTPRGRRVVHGKRVDPVWLPPDWHYVEAAREHRLRVRTLPSGGTRLRDGRRLVVRDSVVGLTGVGGSFAPLPLDEHIVFDGTLFIPPIATRNRQVAGELGRYALDLGNGYLLHGTREPGSIGTATTHGCIRLGDDDLAWLYEHVPVGASVHVR